MPPLKRIIALGAFAALAVVITGEMAARSVGFGKPLLYQFSAAGYEPRPGQQVVRLGKTTTINRMGTRGPELSIQPSGFRILSLGDSVANGGTQANDDETYPALFGAMLARTKPGVEVINASAGGWSVLNEAAWLKSHGTLGARLVVLEVNDQDLDQGFVGADTLDHHPSFPSHRPASGLGEILMRYVLPRTGLTPPVADPGSTGGDFQEGNAQAAFDAVTQIKTFAQDHGARLTLLYWDARLPVSPRREKARNRLLDWAASQGMTVIRPQLNKSPFADRYFRDQIHPSVEGNRIVAEMLENSLLKEI